MKRSPMRPQSKDKARERAERRALVEQWISEGRTSCEVGQRWMHEAWRHEGERWERVGRIVRRHCWRRIEGIHERRKRSSGGSVTNPVNLMASCNACNLLVENEPTLAHEAGLVVRPGDDDWDLCGADRD